MPRRLADVEPQCDWKQRDPRPVNPRRAAGDSFCAALGAAAFLVLVGLSAVEVGACAAAIVISAAIKRLAAAQCRHGSLSARSGAKTPATITRYYPYGYGLYRPWLYRPAYYPYGYGYAYRPYYGAYGYPYGGFYGGGLGYGYYGGGLGYGYYGGGWPYYSAVAGAWPYYTSAYGGWPYYSMSGYYGGGGWPYYNYGVGNPYMAGYGGFGY